MSAFCKETDHPSKLSHLTFAIYCAYVLYINPQTKPVDQFLPAVSDFGVTAPLLMKMAYQTVHEMKVPAFRKYIPADWEGNIKGED